MRRASRGDSLVGHELTRDGWWRLGWLVDQGRTARWEEVWRPRPEALRLAARFDGELVRLRRLPDGYGALERSADGAHRLLDLGPFGIEAIVTRGWAAGPRPPAGALLVGPTAFVAAALRRHQASARRRRRGRGQMAPEGWMTGDRKPGGPGECRPPPIVPPPAPIGTTPPAVRSRHGPRERSGRPAPLP